MTWCPLADVVVEEEEEEEDGEDDGVRRGGGRKIIDWLNIMSLRLETWGPNDDDNVEEDMDDDADDDDDGENGYRRRGSSIKAANPLSFASAKGVVPDEPGETISSNKKVKNSCASCCSPGLKCLRRDSSITRGGRSGAARVSFIATVSIVRSSQITAEASQIPNQFERRVILFRQTPVQRSLEGWVEHSGLARARNASTDPQVEPFDAKGGQSR